MKERAPALYRWTETMNRPGIFDAELWNAEPTYFKIESLPDTLLEFLKLLCADFAPELVATAQAFSDWLDANPDLPAGSLVSLSNEKTLRQSLGTIQHFQQGIIITRDAWPDILLMHQDITEIVDSMDDSDRQTYEKLMKAVGGNDFLSVCLPRQLVRESFSTILG